MVLIDIYVSNVPDPDLVNIGFDIVYNSDQLEVVSANIDKGNRDKKNSRVTHTSPEIEMIGGRLEPGLCGNNIRLEQLSLSAKLWVLAKSGCMTVIGEVITMILFS